MSWDQSLLMNIDWTNLGEEIISGIARISEQEKKEAIDIIIKRGWGMPYLV